MSQISQLSKLALYHRSPSLLLSLFRPCSATTKSRGLPSFCDWLVWCLFPPIGTCFIACKHLPLTDTFATKAHFYCFFLHQTQNKRDGNVLEKAWRTSFTVSPVLDVPVRPSTQEVGRGVGLAASYTQTSTDSDSTLLSSRIKISSDPNGLGPDSFSLINPQQSV